MKPITRHINAQYLGAAILILLWCTISWWMTEQFFIGRMSEQIHQTQAISDTRADVLGISIEKSLDYLSGIPDFFTHAVRVNNSLTQNNVNGDYNNLPRQLKAKRLLADPVLLDMDKTLKVASEAFHVSLLHVVNSKGDSIAASNWDTPSSTIGTNFSERDYFALVKKGLRGHQYAVGRTTHIAGLFFSSPVIKKGDFKGAVIAKIDVPDLAYLIQQRQAFVVDKHGVIILAHNKNWEMRVLPGGSVNKLSAAEMEDIYTRNSFQTLTIESWGDKRFSSMLRVDNNDVPQVLASRNLPDYGLTIYVELPLTAYFTMKHDQQVMFLLLSSLGSLLLVSALGFASYVQTMRRTRETLKSSEFRFKTLESATFEGVIISSEGRVLDVNDQLVRMLGYQRIELIGQQVLDHIAPEDRDRIRGIIEKATESHAELSMLHKDGRRITVEARGHTMTLSGVQTRLTAIRDISERKELDVQLRIAATAFESHEGMVITDEHTRILKVNHAFTDITGYAAADVIGQKPSILSSGRHDAQFYAAMWDGIRSHGAWEGEVWNRRKNGQIYPEHLTITAVKDTNGHVTNYVGALTDSTERQKTLEQLRSAASELEIANMQVEEERARLAERVLERTAQLQMANHAKDAFLATMSHEIRTPLGGMLGMMELLSLSSLTPDQRDKLDVAQTSGKSLLRIVNDILDWSKIEAGKLELAVHEASISEMLNNVAGTYTQLASDKGISLRIEIDPALSARHLFDPLRLSQILNNFTSNAVKFTDQGHVLLLARRHAAQHGFETVRFSVQDSGMGIAKEQQTRLFLHYEQATADIARMYGGTGLGLAICRRLAELMDGTLSVESQPGIGSIFSFTVSLPVADTPVADAQTSVSAIPPSAAEPLNLGGHHVTVLVVDDHPVNRVLLKQQLEMLGVKVDTANDGAKAFVAWQSSHYDLIITDCHMPEMDGYELSYRIRDVEQQAKGQHIPIIAWTANVLAEEQTNTQAAGMDDLLTKPTELNELKAMLLKWLPEIGTAQQDIPAPAPSEASNEVFNPDTLAKFVPERAMQAEMLKAFVVQNRLDVDALQHTLQGADGGTIAKAAHRIKGASRMIGAKALEGLCLDIEQAAKQNNIEQARSLALSLENTMIRTEEAINRHMQG